jgi:hypothetical protein
MFARTVERPVRISIIIHKLHLFFTPTEAAAPRVGDILAAILSNSQS